MFFRSYTLAILLSVSTQLASQWDSYEAVWQGRPGVMMVQLDLYDHAPYLELPNLLEITQTSLECDPQGYPTAEFIETSEGVISDLDSAFSKYQYVENAGRLIYQCKVRDYFYIEDSREIEDVLKSKNDILIDYQFKSDPQWKVYLDYIYPDAYLRQIMINGRILKTLQEENILIKDKRQLLHFASFKTKVDMHDYRRFLLGLNFKIGDMEEDASKEYGHFISFSRKDRLDVEKLSNTTLRLEQRADSLDGVYEGWEMEIN